MSITKEGRANTSVPPQNSSVISIERAQMGTVPSKARAKARREWRIPKALWQNVLSLAVFLAFWEVGARIANSPFVPGPLAVLQAGANLAANGDVNGISLLEHTGQSLLRIFSGFVAAALMAIPLGLAMGLSPGLYAGTRSVIEPIRFIPPIAWIPVAIVVLVGFSRYVFIIWLGAFFPIWINTIVAVPRIEPVYFNVARVHGATMGYVIRRIVIPGALPNIFAGMRIGLGVGWMCIVAAEMIGGEMTGLGKLILKYAELLRMPEIIVGMVIIGILGFLMNDAMLAAEKRLFGYRQQQSA